jgi:excisionase family DNA binding protein
MDAPAAAAPALTTTEAARMLGLSVDVVVRMIRAGKLPAWRTPGGHRRLDLADVIEAQRLLHERRR